MADPLRIMIVDDHPVVRTGLRAMFARRDGRDIVAEAATGADALGGLGREPVDVVLLDLNLPDMRGEDLAADIVRTAPEAKIIVLTMEQDDERMVAALRAGAMAYLLKGADPDELVQAIGAVVRGERPTVRSIGRQMARMSRV